MEKKYKVEKALPINIGLLVGHIYDESYFKYLDIARIIKEEYIKEVKEDTLESIIDENFIGDEIKKNLKQCIIKQKIELLKEVLSHKCSFENIGGQWIGKVVIDDKISELQKEMNENN
jgi:translation elongation factor EF-G